MATMEYENENGRYEEDHRYDRDRSASPRPKRDDDYRGGRDRSASPGGRRMDSRDAPPENRSDERETAAPNSGSNLFVTGLPPSLVEDEVTRMFEKYGDVENCSIMKDPHTGESRRFGFVKMATSEQADQAKEGLQGESIQGCTLSIEKARRNRPRTPTPGRYFGPPKRESFRGDERRGPGRGFRDGGYRDSYSRYDDDRRGGGGGRGRRDDHYRRDGDRYGGERGGYDRRERDDRRGGYGDYGREQRNYDRGDRDRGDRGDRERGDRYYDRR